MKTWSMVSGAPRAGAIAAAIRIVLTVVLLYYVWTEVPWATALTITGLAVANECTVYERAARERADKWRRSGL